MTPISRAGTFRTMPTIHWAFDGRHGLLVRLRSDIPSHDDLMIRSALIRSTARCERLGALDRAINRELWPLGYVAQVDPAVGRGAPVVVDIAPG
jgi:hypothetical protein